MELRGICFLIPIDVLLESWIKDNGLEAFKIER